ncbi:MAG: M55 family metallopeptidase [Phycisphaerales bacterium]|nr:MAG: M55 family metallopeptidase [Phycisphaerales bacterium]
MGRTVLAAGVFCSLVFWVSPLQAEEGLKVFVSVDMEGITGVISIEETGSKGTDYAYYRTLMTEEVNAAIEGAAEAGAAEIVVRDSHGSGRNLMPEELDPRAKLLRDWAGGPFGMMEGIDESYDAVVFVGYHAKAGTKDATLDHTMSGTIGDLRVNGVSLPEAGWNGLIAGCYGVPVILVAGDKAICEQARSIFGDIETVAVKEGIGEAGLNLHPQRSRDLIKAGVKTALGRLGEFKPLKYEPPYTMEVQFKNEPQAYRASWFAGAKRVGDWGVSYTSDEFVDLMRFLMLAGRSCS